MQKINSASEVNLYKRTPRDLHTNEEFMRNVENNAEKALSPLYEEIPYEGESILDKHFIQELEGMEWMKDCRFHLVKSNKLRQKKVLDNLIRTLKKKAVIVPEFVNGCGLPMLALDTETTSLITNFSIHGGEIIPEVSLVGIPLAISDTEGYYIPVNHNETDKVRNFDKEIIQEFLQRLTKEFFIIYFNAEYDINILHLQGVKVQENAYADLVLIGSLLGFDTMIDSVPDFGFSLGLKNLSRFFLGRKMLEIQEVLQSKQFIVFSRICATYSLCYAVADSTNTYGLFKTLILEEEEADYNPYLSLEAMTKLNHKALFHSASMFKYGLPLNDLESLKANLLTVINRTHVIEDTYKKIKDSEKYAIGTPEKVNEFIASKVLNEVLRDYMQVVISLDLLKNTKHKKFHILENFLSSVADDFGVKVKIDSNKSRGEFVKFETVKVGWGKSAKGVEVLTLTKKAVKSDYWEKLLKPKTLKELSILAEIVDEYRSLILERGRLGKMYRYARGDDRGFAVARVGLRFGGTDTKRYKNSSGSGEDRFVFSGATNHLVKFTTGNALCGINAQGLPSNSNKYINYNYKDKTDKIKKIIRIKDKRFNTWLKAKKKRLKDALDFLLLTKLNQKK